jgi:ribosomal protein S18 acetylase RimI-like enzyme
LRSPLPADLIEIAALITNLIPRHLGGDLTPEGRAHLLGHIRPGAIGARLRGICHPARNGALVAMKDSRILGLGAVRDDSHITLLYVAEAWHGRGIGRRLMDALIADIRHRHPGTTEITLNSVPRATAFYLRLGFRPIGPCCTRHGGRSQPMALSL